MSRRHWDCGEVWEAAFRIVLLMSVLHPFSYTLYTYPENWRAFKALIAAQYSGAQVRVLSAPPHFHFGQTNRIP